MKTLQNLEEGDVVKSGKLKLTVLFVLKPGMYVMSKVNSPDEVGEMFTMKELEDNEWNLVVPTPKTTLHKGLEWGETSEKEMTWEEAKNWCESHGEGWRMPERWELVRAYDEKVEGFERSGVYLWSATEYSSTDAWGVGLGNGNTSTARRVANQVRCVREVVAG